MTLSARHVQGVKEAMSSQTELSAMVGKTPLTIAAVIFIITACCRAPVPKWWNW